MKLSEDGKKWADALLGKSMYEVATWAEDDHRRVLSGATQSNPNFETKTEHYVERVRRSIQGLVNSYVEGFKIDNALIDDEDKDEILEEVRRVIQTNLHHITTSVTNRDFRDPYTGERVPNMDSYLGARFERLLGEAAIELNLARNKLAIEKKRKEAERLSTGNLINIHGPNLGQIQQGGHANVQNVNINAEFEKSVNELFALIENSSLTPLQKLRAVNDIRAVHELSRLETMSEVQEEAKRRLEGVTSVISLSADLLSIGMPIMQIIRAFFGL